MKIPAIWTRYFNSWWMPAALCLALLAAVTLIPMTGWLRSAVLENSLFALFAGSLAGIPAAAIWNLIKRRWVKGLLNILMIPVCLMGLVSSLVMTTFGPDSDGFADHLAIPDGLAVAEPVPQRAGGAGAGDDAFQARLLGALSADAKGDSSITASLPSLASLAREHPELLKRFLASDPFWRVFEERGNLCATRRWRLGPDWRWNLHGYYTRHDLDAFNEYGLPDFQFRMTIGLGGKPWWRGNKSSGWLEEGDTKVLPLSSGNDMFESHCVISAPPVAVELFEQSGAEERRLTKAALAHLEKELAPLAENPSWETAKSLLPAGSVTQGSPSFLLRESFQPGIYESEIRVNPGEPGMVFLKAFEVTKGTPLSVSRLKERSNEWVGWSENPEELFLSNTDFTIYEGDWGKPYAARFEVWFAPDSGAPQRKLLEKIYKIEGWQR